MANGKGYPQFILTKEEMREGARRHIGIATRAVIDEESDFALRKILCHSGGRAHDQGHGTQTTHKFPDHACLVSDLCLCLLVMT